MVGGETQRAVSRLSPVGEAGVEWGVGKDEASCAAAALIVARKVDGERDARGEMASEGNAGEQAAGRGQGQWI